MKTAKSYSLALITAVTCFSGFTAFAEDSATTGMTETTAAEATRGLRDELVALKPQVGSLIYTDNRGDTASRALYGLSAEVNALRGSNVYLGPATGFFYSHLGSSDANFFGSAPDESNAIGAGANFLQVPINLKVGYVISDSQVRLSAHGGGNLTYRSIAYSSTLSSGDALNQGSDWTIYPNVGADLEFGPVVIRPDWTITPENDVYSAMLGAIIPIG